MIKAVIFDYGAVLRRRLFLQPKLFALAAELRKIGIKTAVLSNMYSPIGRYIKWRGELKDFELVIYSYDIGFSKPDPRAFNSILEQLKFKPSECLFVDNRLSNINAAQKLGMKTVQAKRTIQTIADIKKALTGS